MKVSIIIPVFNQVEMTRECLAAVRAHTQDYEIILVDNGSDDKTWIMAVMDPDLVYIPNETNLGFPVAINQGIRVAKGDVIILLNNDVIVTPQWTELLISHLDKFAVVGPLTNYVSGRQQTTLPIYNNQDELNKQAEIWNKGHNRKSKEVNWIIGFCMAFKRSLFNEFGPFDESLWPCSGEEIDLCFKVRRGGYKIGIAEDVYVHHFGSQTFRAMQDSGQIDYNQIVVRNEKHLTERWGKDWYKQDIQNENK